MNHHPSTRRFRWPYPPFLSAGDLVLRAAVIAAAYLAVHLAGWREYTTFLSGTMVEAGGSLRWTAFCGLSYLVLHFAWVLGVPILLLAAGLLKLVAALGTRRAPATSPPPAPP